MDFYLSQAWNTSYTTAGYHIDGYRLAGYASASGTICSFVAQNSARVPMTLNASWLFAAERALHHDEEMTACRPGIFRERKDGGLALDPYCPQWTKIWDAYRDMNWKGGYNRLLYSRSSYPLLS